MIKSPMEGAQFNFVPQQQKKSVLDNKNVITKLMQWSMKGCLKLKYYNFNQQFYPYQKQQFVDSFFKDPNVYSTLEIYQRMDWHSLGTVADKVEYEFVPSTQTSMSFFDKILDPDNNIVREGGRIQQCMEETINGFYIENHLMAMFLDENHESYNLYSKSERNEFLFRLLEHLCLGGQWCQRDDSILSYLDVIKVIYKDIMSVERDEGSACIRIRSIVLKVVAYDKDDKPLYPNEPSNVQNFLYLIIDPFKRTVSTLSHQYGAVFTN